MNTITMYATYNTADDTKLTFNKTDDRAEIILEFTGEDPNYGKETWVCGGDPKETLLDLCKGQLDEITKFLNETEDGTYRPVDITMAYPDGIGDLCTSSLIAFERMLQGIIGQEPRKVKMGRNKNGHMAMTDTIRNIAPKIAEAFWENKVSKVYIATDCEEGNLDPEDPEGWYKIVRQELTFDNLPGEMLLVMGYLGGGNVTTAYKCYEDLPDEFDFVSKVTEMICGSTGEDENAVIYAEFIGVDDVHSYDIDPKEPDVLNNQTRIGTLFVEKINSADYPGFNFGIKRRDKKFVAGFIEVDQNDSDAPLMKLHAYDPDLAHDEPAYDAWYTTEEIDEFLKGAK